MRKLSSLILLLLLSASLSAQKSPHGDSFTANCDDCHKTDGWKVDLKTISFDHAGTKFPLVGQHKDAACKACHTTLEFAKAPTECSSCHADMHEQTVGTECGRCHTPNSWIVTNITRLHQQGRFPLIGRHTTADCRDCHKNLLSVSTTASPTASRLRFDPMGIECYDCHKKNYQATTQPNHIQDNFSTNCADCHNINAFSWKGAGFNHAGVTQACISCHQPNYAATTNPNHTALNFSTNCKDCHTTDPGWKPAQFRDHDAKFPIYSGKHNGQWNSCADCHTNPGNYTQYICIDCHEHNQATTDGKHNGVPGYAYNSIACYGCHPSGTGQGTFDHNAAGFPLSGGHTSVACTKCHTSGFAGTSPVCASCHTNTYNQTANPNHSTIGITNECATCHTLNPGWNPATFPTHNTYYVLEGKHISTSCADCHNGNYVTTPNTCVGCHQNNYNQTTTPNHAAALFPVTCADCHSQTAWKPSNWDHDGQYFPINSGKHNGKWNTCADCHANSLNYAEFTCTGSCHPQPTMNSKHQGVGGYQYSSPACYSCHPTGTAQGFDHAAAGFSLTGGHSTVLCVTCHNNVYIGTSSLCSDCHTPNYNQTANPNHAAIGIANTCANCHTLNPGWAPASFPTHNNYYVLAGAHIAVANNCAVCHQGNYVNSPNTCYGCHAANYNQTTNPNHVTAQFATTCENCHSQSAWSPSTFNHNTTYPLTGAHTTVPCAQCHSAGYSNTPNTCAGCHQTKFNQTTNPNHAAIGIPTVQRPSQ